MKRIAVLALVSIALGGVPYASNAANPSAGANCSRAGLIQISKGKKFTCVKSGKKLVWNKGILVPKEPKASPSATPTSNSEVKPSPKPTNSLDSSPLPKAMPLWQEVQFKLVSELSKLTPTKIQQLNFILSPNANKETANKLSTSYQEPISLLSNLFVNPIPVTFLIMNENDKEWWTQQVKNLNSNQDLGWWGSHCAATEYIHCGYGSTPNPDGTFHFGQLLGSKFVWQTQDYVIAYHESIHVYQLGLMGNRMNDLPSWFAEGQANYLGIAFVHKYRDSEDVRNGELKDLLSRFPELRSYKTSEWIEFLGKIDANRGFTFENRLGYSIGCLMNEDLYNKFGYQKMHQWLVEIKAGQTYKDAFKKVFGIDYMTWLSEGAAPYLDNQIS
jgi:hypothetical protein